MSETGAERDVSVVRLDARTHTVASRGGVWRAWGDPIGWRTWALGVMVPVVNGDDTLAGLAWCTAGTGVGTCQGDGTMAVGQVAGRHPCLTDSAS